MITRLSLTAAAGLLWVAPGLAAVPTGAARAVLRPCLATAVPGRCTSPSKVGLDAAQPPALAFSEFFVMPVGRRGLEFTERAKSLNGKRVTVTGFMARRCDPVPGQFIVASLPIDLHEHEMGLCDDLPPSALWVDLPAALAKRYVVHRRGPLRLTGTLQLDSRPEPDGRVSAAQLKLDEDCAAAWIATTEHSEQHDGHAHATGVTPVAHPDGGAGAHAHGHSHDLSGPQRANASDTDERSSK